MEMMLSLIAGVFFFQWKPRRVASDNGPRTIQAIRQEAANVSDIQIIGAFCHLFYNSSIWCVQIGINNSSFNVA